MTFEYIEREFGREIAEDVQALSKDPNINYKEDREALEAYLIKAFSRLRTAIAKTLDRVHNFGTLGATPLSKQLRVALETEDNFLPLFKWAREEYPEYSALFFTSVISKSKRLLNFTVKKKIMLTVRLQTTKA